MSDNTALIQDLFGSIAQEGWSTKFNDALADDLVWVATGSSPVAGTYKGKQVYLEKIIKRLGDRLQSWLKPVVENLFVDGDTACIQVKFQQRYQKRHRNCVGIAFRVFSSTSRLVLINPRLRIESRLSASARLQSRLMSNLTFLLVG
jgi:ketosteroid isomerase-like protein